MVTISGGLTSSAGAGPLTPEGLLHAADLVLYEAKAAGRNTLRVAAQPLGVPA